MIRSVMSFISGNHMGEKSSVLIPRFIRLGPDIALPSELKVRPGNRFGTLVVGLYPNRYPKVSEGAAHGKAFSCRMSSRIDSSIFPVWAALCGYPSPGTAFAGNAS